MGSIRNIAADALLALGAAGICAGPLAGLLGLIVGGAGHALAAAGAAAFCAGTAAWGLLLLVGRK